MTQIRTAARQTHAGRPISACIDSVDEKRRKFHFGRPAADRARVHVPVIEQLAEPHRRGGEPREQRPVAHVSHGSRRSGFRRLRGGRGVNTTAPPSAAVPWVVSSRSVSITPNRCVSRRRHLSTGAAVQKVPVAGGRRGGVPVTAPRRDALTTKNRLGSDSPRMRSRHRWDGRRPDDAQMVNDRR